MRLVPSRGGVSAAVRRLPASARELYWGSGICDDVPALSWFLAIALVPLALGMTALASLALGDYAEAQAVAERAARALPAGVSDQVVQVILRTRRDSTLLIIASIVAMVWAGSGAVGVVERSMSRMLGRRRFGPLAGKARHLGLAAGMVLVIVLMVLAASKVTGLRTRLGLDSVAVQLLLSLAALVATTAVCAGLYRLSPRDGLCWRSACAGAAPAAVVLQLTPTIASFYLRWVIGRSPVQVFLVMAGVLLTCYITAIALLLGAAVASRREKAAAGPALA